MHHAVGREDIAQRLEARVRVAQVVKHACANDLVKGLSELPDALDRKPAELQISYVVFALKVAGMEQARFADVDCGHARFRLHERVPGGLRRAAASDKDCSICARLFQRPKQQILRSAPVRIAIAIETLLETVDRRWIGVRLVERAYCPCAIGGR